MTIEDTARRIFAERATFYTTSKVHADPAVLARLVALAVPQPHWTALDIATGTGHTAFALAPHVAAVTGIDLTPEMLSQAEQLRDRRGVANVVFRTGDVHRLPFADASFDLVTCRRAAHHFSDIHLALREIRRVLRPGGRLVIDDRSVPDDDFIDRCMNLLDRYHDESHVREYRASEWPGMLAASGLTLESLEAYTLHRPVTSMTNGVSPRNVAAIRRVLDGLDEGQRRALNLVAVNGEPHMNHWYVMFSARKD